MLLFEANMRYESREVDVLSGAQVSVAQSHCISNHFSPTFCLTLHTQHNPDYLAVNPRHTVPCLEVHSTSVGSADNGGSATVFRVTEAHSVLRFLCAEAAGLGEWYPKEPRCLKQPHHRQIGSIRRFECRATPVLQPNPKSLCCFQGPGPRLG